ncbi:UvrD-helicase domain-containing protein [Haloparvum sp. AD34]
MTEADSLPEGVEPRDELNDAQRRVVDAALAADSGLFVQASVPGSGKTYASARLCAEYVLGRAAAGADRPVAGLTAAAFNRDAAGQLLPEIADWIRWLVHDGTTPAARAAGSDEVEGILGALRRAEAVGTVDAVIYGVFSDVAGELGFDDPSSEDGYAIDRLHDDAFESVAADPAHAEAVDRLEEAYPSLDEDDADGDRVARILRTLLEAAHENRWTAGEVAERLHGGRDAFYPEGPPSSVADVDRDLERFVGGDAAVATDGSWDAERVVEVDRGLHDAWGDRIDDLVDVYRSYAETYDRLCRERGVVSHVDCAYWVARYFEDPGCAHRWADDTPRAVVAARRDRLRDRWQARVNLLVVDEAQDLSTAQHDALSQLVTDDTRVVLYGDPFQSIYTWRNASPTLFADAIADGVYFGREWDDPVVATAETTYRQRPALTDTVDGVFGPALSDPGRGVAPAVDVDYAPLSPDRADDGRARVHVATMLAPSGDRTRAKRAAEPLAEYLHGGLTEGRFGDGDAPPAIRLLFRSSAAMDEMREAIEDVGLTVGTERQVFDQPLARTVVALLTWLVTPLRTDHATEALGAAAAESDSETLRAVAAHVAAADGDVLAAAKRSAELDADAAELLDELAALAGDVADRKRSTAADLTRRLCATVGVEDDPYGMQPAATVEFRRQVRDELISAVADLAGPDTPLEEVVAGVTAMCDDPDDGPALAVDADDYDVVFETIHSYKGAESDVVAIADPWGSPNGRSYSNTVVARGGTLALCPPAVAPEAATVPIAGYENGLFDPELGWSETNHNGLRWVTNRLRADSETEYAGPPRYASVAAQERAEHWRLGYVAATRARDHLVVPVEDRDQYDPRRSWSHAFGAAFDLDELEGMRETARTVAGEPVRLSKDDVASRDPFVDHLEPWAGRTPETDPVGEVTVDADGCAWLPRFLNASTFHPLSADHDRYVVDHLLGKQLDTDSGATDTEAPLDVVEPGALGQTAHDAIGSLIRSDPDYQATRRGRSQLADHARWAAGRAQLDWGLTDGERSRLEEYLAETVLPEFVETDAFARLCAAETVYVEEPLETRTRLDGLRIEVRGQADFVARDGDEWVIEDVKLAFAEGAEETDERYRLQLATYQWILRRQGVDDDASITSSVTHLDGRDAEHRIRDKEAIEDWIAERLERLGPDT